MHIEAPPALEECWASGRHSGSAKCIVSRGDVQSIAAKARVAAMAAVGDALGVNVLRSPYHSRCEWLQWFDVQCEKGCCAGHSISGCSGGNNNFIAGLLCGALQPEHEAAVGHAS